MESKKLNSLNIEGLGTYAGGEFDRVSISGKGRVTSDLTCRSIDISGMSTIEGKVMCEKIHASGMGKIEQEVTADEVDVSGTLDFHGDLNAKEFYLSGMSKVKQCLKADKIEITGMLSVENDLSGEEIKCDGMIKCGGFLNCESLEIASRGASKLKDIGAANVRISCGESIASGLFSFLLPDFLKENKVTADVIEGDNIVVEHCDVKIVRGKNIKIGRKCKIGLVEYSGTFEADKDSVIDQVNQL